MEKIKRLMILALLIFGFAACSKHSEPTPIIIPPPPPPPPPPINPDSAKMISPVNGQPCLTGTSVSATQSSVTFTWDKAAHTDTYELHIINLLTNDTLVTATAQLTINVTLLKSTPYKWYITSKENSVVYEISTSPWKFYNSGPGVTAYPPYPAELTSPAWGVRVPANAASNITLQWKGTQGSAAIKNYDVYYGTSSSPPLQQGAVTDAFLTVYAAPNTVYYWKIVTRDVNGNTSSSQVFNFYQE